MTPPNEKPAMSRSVGGGMRTFSPEATTPASMSAVCGAESWHVGDEDTEAGREHNRRVDIVIVSSYGMQTEPAPGRHLTSKPASVPVKTDFK